MEASHELLIDCPGGQTKTVPLEGERLYLGRSASAEICFPEDAGLSRQHLVLEREGNDWAVQDLGSKNGTLVNNIPLKARLLLRPGDKIAAGHLVITFDGPRDHPESRVVFVEPAEADPLNAATFVTNLENALSGQTIIQEQGLKGSAQMRALIRAGKELVENRPLPELFPLILKLSIEAVGARRGILLTLENEQLVVQATRGENFRISSKVRDRVLVEGGSVLVKDAQFDDVFRGRHSIVEQRVRTMMAVPLQTNERIIGLIYVDSPSLLDEFTKDDLSLLTVMANVAAIRIEHSRLAEVEQAERLMKRELDQAAEIQRGLLPAGAPVIPEVDLAGYNAACHTVGGDYFDFFPYPNNRIAMVLGDVSGKGMPAALLMVGLQARVQALTQEPGDLASIMGRLNKITSAHCPPGRFITFFLCVLDTKSGELLYANAGHNPPILIRRDGKIEYLQGGGLVLGILPNVDYEQYSVKLDVGDMVVLYSDGVTEAVDPQSTEFGEEGLAALLQQHRSKPAAEIIEEVNNALEKWGAGAPAVDDITMVVAKRTAS